MDKRTELWHIKIPPFLGEAVRFHAFSQGRRINDQAIFFLAYGIHSWVSNNQFSISDYTEKLLDDNTENSSDAEQKASELKSIKKTLEKLIDLSEGK